MSAEAPRPANLPPMPDIPEGTTIFLPPSAPTGPTPPKPPNAPEETFVRDFRLYLPTGRSLRSGAEEYVAAPTYTPAARFTTGYERSDHPDPSKRNKPLPTIDQAGMEQSWRGFRSGYEQRAPVSHHIHDRLPNRWWGNPWSWGKNAHYRNRTAAEKKATIARIGASAVYNPATRAVGRTVASGARHTYENSRQVFGTELPLEVRLVGGMAARGALAATASVAERRLNNDRARRIATGARARITDLYYARDDNQNRLSRVRREVPPAHRERFEHTAVAWVPDIPGKRHAARPEPAHRRPSRFRRGK